MVGKATVPRKSGKRRGRNPRVASSVPDVSELTAWKVVTRQQLGELMGVHPDTVTDYVRQGMPTITTGGRGKESQYDAVACLEWWRARQGKNRKEAAQARAYEASASLNELKLQQESGALWPKEAIILAGQAVQKQWSTTVRALPRRMTHAGIIGRQQEPAVAALCTDLLREIAAWSPVPEKPARRKAKR